MYDDGTGVTEDDREAVRWYRLAASQGNAEAQYRLGNMSVSGQGVPKDEVSAYAWWKVAAGQGHLTAKRDTERLSKRLTDLETEQAQGLFRKYWELRGQPSRQ